MAQEAVSKSRLSFAEPEVRIHLPPAERQQRTDGGDRRPAAPSRRPGELLHRERVLENREGGSTLRQQKELLAVSVFKLADEQSVKGIGCASYFEIVIGIPTFSIRPMVV